MTKPSNYTFRALRHRLWAILSPIRTAAAAVPGYWHALAWLGSIGLGLVAFLVAALRLHPVYHAFEDIVATSAFTLYPEQQDLWFYLMAITLIPVFSVAGYWLWALLITGVRILDKNPSLAPVAAISFWNMIWWLRPVGWAFARVEPPISAETLTIVYWAGNGLILAYVWLARRGTEHPRQSPPAAAWQLGVLVIGCGVGFALNQVPLKAFAGLTSGQQFMAGMFFVWLFWLAASALLAFISKQSWNEIAENSALALLPLFLLAPVDLVWFEVYQNGSRVGEFGSRQNVLLLVGFVMVACAATGFWVWRKRPALDKGQRAEFFWKSILGFGIPLLLITLFYIPSIHQPLDLFHEGESLAPAYGILSGQVPFKEVLFVHGFLRDPGVALAAFSLSGESYASLRQLNNFVNPLVVIATYFLILALVRQRWAFLLVIIMLTAAWPLFFDWRMIPALLAIICLVIFFHQDGKRRMTLPAIAGLLTFVSLATSTDIGVVALASGVVVVTFFTLRYFQQDGLRLLFAYFGPLLVCSGLVLGYLANQQALGDFFTWNIQILQIYRDWNGMPFPFPPETLQQAWFSFLSPFSSILALLALAQRLMHGRWEKEEWTVLLLLLANLALFNRAIVSGYDSNSALEAGSHFAPLLLLALLAPWNLDFRPRDTVLIAVCLGFAMVPLSSGRLVIGIIDKNSQRNRVEVAGDWRLSTLDRIGPIFLPPDQAASLEEIVPFLHSASSFWDFSDHPALFFLSQHTSVSRYYVTHHLITSENQRKLIHDLQSSPPQVIVFRSGTGWDSIAGIDRVLRSFLVSEYILENYHFYGIVGGFTVLAYGAPTPPDHSLDFYVDMGYLPALWGRDRWDALLRYQPDFSSPCQPGAEGLEPLSYIWTCDLDPRQATYLAISIDAKLDGDGPVKAQLSWKTAESDYSEQAAVGFDLLTSAGEHTYLLRLASIPAWSWSGHIAEISLAFEDGSPSFVEIRPLEFLTLDESRAPSQP